MIMGACHQYPKAQHSEVKHRETEAGSPAALGEVGPYMSAGLAGVLSQPFALLVLSFNGCLVAPLASLQSRVRIVHALEEINLHQQYTQAVSDTGDGWSVPG